MSAETLQAVSLINSLMHPDQFDPPPKKCELIETHISWVILAGPYAYKIKKAIDLGFLDFSTLEKRHFFCQEELRLNRRLAPEIYLSVVPITGSVEQPRWAGGGEPIEYAVKMRAFPQEAQLDRALAINGLEPRQIDILAKRIADFHALADVAAGKSNYGEPEVILQPIEENFRQIREHVSNSTFLDKLKELKQWSEATYTRLYPSFGQRKTDGFIRECHGDMHLQNIAWQDDAPIVFDCIEFSPSLRWIDVISDVAFLLMDLEKKKQGELAQRFLGNYLEYTGDYAGVRLLRFYQVYRALVRAKIDAIRAHQPGIEKAEKVNAETDFSDYLQLALGYIQPVRPRLIITRGMSASGKSTVSKVLLEHLGAIRIRSDVERKRLFGLGLEDDGHAAVGEGMYTAEATEKTYSKLEELAAVLLGAGYSVLVDAVFLHRHERQRFQALAASRETPFVILEFTADAKTLRERIVKRKNDVSDANLKVLEMQLSRWQPLASQERGYAITVDTTGEVDTGALAAEIKGKACF
ncbi:bifunctional aminoglycoside phosphotransferase/ATP-binding protein [Desulforhopalus sp. IMCC35007]|uniref:bifunctional aminoglycoside phosphotransferase/ATP-binding protein n=1 Tax=Desulforhopalus sp. IMCC35007 TaxID=2569543 RepID=UPI0010ADF0F7|nr:bifunctional aminoglycoside phosphotransferase/ATP-binding protein [Desulforhopalus sp. IMCC35007]TKB11812.1 aminoglycoside phosphotransferase [Desulforhopalus sp. IMCC35007]